MAGPTIWARTAWATIDLAEGAGFDKTRMFRGVPFDETQLRAMRRVSWNDYARLCENLDDLCGGEVEDLLESSYHTVIPEVRAAVGALVDPRSLYRLLINVFDPIMLPTLESEVVELSDRHLRVTIHLVAGRPCEVFFRGTIGAMRGVPRHLNQPPAVVTALYGPTYGIYTIELPPPISLRRRMRSALGSAVNMVIGLDANGSPIRTSFAHGDPIDNAVANWRLTPKQTEVLRHVVLGRTNKEIAMALACAENTIELHMTQLLRKSGSTSRTQLVLQVS